MIRNTMKPTTEMVDYERKRVPKTISYTLPTVLAVSMNIFSFDQKLGTLIKLSLNNVRIPQYITLSNTRYELKSFVAHIGSRADRGHYVAYCKHENQWKLFNEAICYENPIAEWGHRLCCFEFFCIESAGSSPEAIR